MDGGSFSMDSFKIKVTICIVQIEFYQLSENMSMPGFVYRVPLEKN